MLRQLATRLVSRQPRLLGNAISSAPASITCLDKYRAAFDSAPLICNNHNVFNNVSIKQTSIRMFHAANSKVKYLDFRYKFPSNHLRCHLLIIRRQKMKKHQKRKWRRKFKCILAKTRLKREIAKEKTFRVELLTMIRRAEEFEPRDYALRKIQESLGQKQIKTKEEKFEELKELIRVHRYQTTYVKPKHKRIETYGLLEPPHQKFATN